MLQIDHRTAHLSQTKRASPKFNTTALGLSNDRQFDDVATEEMLSQLSWVFEGENRRALREEWCGTSRQASRGDSMSCGRARDRSVDEHSQSHKLSES
jgi:hypothetical protein